MDMTERREREKANEAERERERCVCVYVCAYVCTCTYTHTHTHTHKCVYLKIYPKQLFQTTDMNTRIKDGGIIHGYLYRFCLPSPSSSRSKKDHVLSSYHVLARAPNQFKVQRFPILVAGRRRPMPLACTFRLQVVANGFDKPTRIFRYYRCTLSLLKVGLKYTRSQPL